jgi:hypothetical protein
LVFLLIGFAFGPVKTATLVGFLIVQARSWFDSGWVCMVVQSVARLAAPVNGLNNDYIYILTQLFFLFHQIIFRFHRAL